jgi:internalin A
MPFQEKIKQRIAKARENNFSVLSLRDCAFTHIPDEVLELKKLEILDLSGNQLKKLPKEFNQLKNLHGLDLGDNQFMDFPEEICQLPGLKHLNLKDNHLKELPEEVSRLHNLHELHLTGNQFTEFPPSICQLRNLQYLFFGRNHLRTLPKEISQLANLIYLNLDDNPLEIPPPEIAERGIDAIRNFYKELEKEEFDYLYEIKLLVIGEGRVGKTSLVKSLTNPGYRLEAEHTIEGINIKQWDIPQNQLGLTKDFRVNIWDFGGQEIYHSTHQFFLTRRSVYLLVTEARKDDKHEDFYYWLNLIRLLGDQSPVIIVQNKCDQPFRDIPISEYRGAFNEIVDFRKISCRPEPEYKATMESLRLDIKNLLKNDALLPHIGSPLPKVWLEIRNQLEELKQSGKNYISRNDYLKICNQYGMDEERAIYLSEFFHDLGVILHFNDDWDLRDTVFLNHEWVTQGVYSVLDNGEVKKNQGIFDNSDLIHIWKDEKFRDKPREFLSLMKNKKFELCFQLEEGKYLAPQLLPVDEKKYQWKSSEKNLYFEYRYKFMPKGILARLIVKRNKYIHNKTMWKYGVLLDLKNTRAIVRERYFERKITIQLEGDNKKKLLDLIRKSIRDIHSDFNNLEVVEMIPCNCKECKTGSEPYLFNYDRLLRRLDKNKLTIECDNSFEKIDIQALLGEIIIPESRSLNSIFISYSHKDRDWFGKVVRHLRPLQRVGKIEPWSDVQIKPGTNWRKEIEQALRTAKIALLLISADFYASDFIVENELPALLKNASQKGTKILSLIIKPSRFDRDKNLSRFQAINDPSQPLISLTEYEQEKVLKEMAEIIEDY